MGNPASCSHNDWTALVQVDDRVTYQCRRCSRQLDVWEILRSLQNRVETLEGVPDSGSTLLGRMTGMASHLDLLQIYLKEILVTLRGDTSLFIRTPHLRERVNEIETQVDAYMKMGKLPSHTEVIGKRVSWWCWLMGKF